MLQHWRIKGRKGKENYIWNARKNINVIDTNSVNGKMAEYTFNSASCFFISFFWLFSPFNLFVSVWQEFCSFCANLSSLYRIANGMEFYVIMVRSCSLPRFLHFFFLFFPFDSGQIFPVFISLLAKLLFGFLRIRILFFLFLLLFRFPFEIRMEHGEVFSNCLSSENCRKNCTIDAKNSLELFTIVKREKERKKCNRARTTTIQTHIHIDNKATNLQKTFEREI